MTSQALPQRMMKTNNVTRLRFELVAAEFLLRMGARIEQKRKTRGLSRSDLARQLPGKVSENQIYRWERGKHQPNPDTLQAIADALGCDVAELMAPEPTAHTTPDLSSDSQPSLADIMEVVSRLEDQIRLLRADLALRDAEELQRTEASAPASLPARRRQQR